MRTSRGGPALKSPSSFACGDGESSLGSDSGGALRYRVGGGSGGVPSGGGARGNLLPGAQLGLPPSGAYGYLQGGAPTKTLEPSYQGVSFGLAGVLGRTGVARGIALLVLIHGGERLDKPKVDPY